MTVRQVGDEIHVSVQDTGEGIPVDQLPYVFERFYRTDHARSRDKEGSGLGLTIARSLVEAHGGRIWAKNIVGQGSTFTFVPRPTPTAQVLSLPTPPTDSRQSPEA